MLKERPLSRFIVLFSSIFVGLMLISNISAVQKAHCAFYSAVATPIFNVINPHIYADFSPGTHESNPEWDIEFKIWDKRKHGRQIFVESYRQKNPPNALVYQKHHEIILLPLIFILSLLIACPLGLKAKLFRLASAASLFYLFMTLYLSYRFELTLNKNELPLDGIWHLMISFFGLGGNTDPIYIFAFLLCAVLVVPKLIREGKIQFFTQPGKSKTN